MNYGILKYKKAIYFYIPVKISQTRLKDEGFRARKIFQ